MIDHPSLYIETEQGDIPVLHDIILAFAPYQSFFPAGGHAPQFCKRLKRNDFSADESFFKVCMDLSSGLGRFRPFYNGPGATFILAGCQEGYQSKQFIACGNEPVESALPDTEFLKEFFFLFLIHGSDILLDGGGNDDNTCVFCGSDAAYAVHIRDFVLILAKIVFRNIGGIDYRLGCEQEPALQDLFLLLVAVHRSGRFPAFQMGVKPLGKLSFGSRFLVPSAETLLRFVLSFLNRVHIRKNQFQVNRLDIPGRINISVDMDNVVIIKTADNMNNCVYFTDMGKKLVSQAFTPACSLYQPRNIHKFDGCRCYFFRIVHPGKNIQPVIRHKNNTRIGFDGTERIVFSLRARIGDCIEQSAFPDIRKAYNSEFHNSAALLANGMFRLISDENYIRSPWNSQALQTLANMIEYIDQFTGGPIMSILHSAFLGLIQGLGEFLPVSSSGHLLLARFFLGIRTDSEAMKMLDILLHVGTLIPVLIIFRKDWIDMILHPVRNKTLLLLLLASLPTLLIYLAAKKLFPDVNGFSVFDSGWFLGTSFLITSLFLLLCDRYSYRRKSGSGIVGILQAIVMGLFQGIGLIPGVSRSGSTILGGVCTGLSRTNAAKFSFMMSAPAIVGSLLMEGKDAVEKDLFSHIDILPSLVGILVAAAVGYLSIRFMLKVIARVPLSWFALYLAVLGIIFLVLQLSGSPAVPPFAVPSSVPGAAG